MPGGRGQWPLRLLGMAFGLGVCSLGAFSWFGGGEALPQPLRERAAGFGVTLLAVGAIAIAGSLLMRRVDRLWYRKPPRWRMLHGEPTDWRKWWRP
jgi:hypothetical protein